MILWDKQIKLDISDDKITDVDCDKLVDDLDIAIGKVIEKSEHKEKLTIVK